MTRYPSLVTGSLLWLSILAGLPLSEAWTLDPRKDLGQMAGHMTTVFNNTLYTIGGSAYYWTEKEVKFSQQSNNDKSKFIIKTSNSYLRALDLSIPLNLGFEGSDPSEIISELPFEIPHTKRGAFWVDRDVIYLWGGELESGSVYQNGAFQNRIRERPDPKKYYTYDLRQTKGSNTWNTVSISEVDGSRELVISPAEGGYAYSAEARKMFYLGGEANGDTFKNYDGSNATDAGFQNYHLPGMITFNLETGEWKNETISKDVPNFSELSALNDIKDNVVVYVKGVGEKGILVVIGGRNWVNVLYPLSTVYVYDIAGGKWYHQPTTSKSGSKNPPDTRVGSFCAVAVAAPDKSSFTIYIYGGFNFPGPYGVKGTWALSMPSFQWFSVDATGDPAGGRFVITCEAIGGQMAMVRGRAAIDEQMDENGGTYFYDMTNLTWSNRYKPAEYTVPKTIYREIGGNGRGGANATGPPGDTDFDNGLGRLFAAAREASSAPIPSSSAPIPSSSLTKSPNRESHAKKTRVIVGSVVGVAVGVAILAGVGIWMRRRKRRVATARGLQPAPSYGEGKIDNEPIQQNANESDT